GIPHRREFLFRMRHTSSSPPLSRTARTAACCGARDSREGSRFIGVVRLSWKLRRLPRAAHQVRGAFLACFADEENADAYRIFDIHLPVAPRLVRRGKVDADVASKEFLMQTVDIVHAKVYDTSGNAVS